MTGNQPEEVTKALEILGLHSRETLTGNDHAWCGWCGDSWPCQTAELAQLVIDGRTP